MPPTATMADANSSTTPGTSWVLKYGLLAAILACAVNGAILIVARDILGVPAVFPLFWDMVFTSTMVSAFAAVLVYAVIARRSSRPNRIFTVVAAVALAVSFVGIIVPPPELGGAPLSVYGTLVVMHVAAAVSIVSLLIGVPTVVDSTGSSP